MMARKRTFHVAFGLLGLMACAGMLSGIGALLMVAPFLLLFGLLLAGLYPGERAIQAVALLLSARPRSRRPFTSSLDFRPVLARAIRYPGGSGSHAPPHFA